MLQCHQFLVIGISETLGFSAYVNNLLQIFIVGLTITGAFFAYTTTQDKAQAPKQKVLFFTKIMLVTSITFIMGYIFYNVDKIPLNENATELMLLLVSVLVQIGRISIILSIIVFLISMFYALIEILMPGGKSARKVKKLANKKTRRKSP